MPRFGLFLAKLENELRQELGFKLIRGLPVERYDDATFSTIFCGIGSHLGLARSQNTAGHLLGHVKDIRLNIADPSNRVYQTTARQHFHTDSCDVAELLCLKEGKEGEKSMLASSVTIYNEMSKRSPAWQTLCLSLLRGIGVVKFLLVRKLFMKCLYSIGTKII